MDFANNVLRQPRSALVYRIITSLIGWSALLSLWAASVAERPVGSSAFGAITATFRYFTVQTNLFVLIWLLVAIRCWNRERVHPFLQPLVKGAITVYITVTFVIFATLLQGLVDPQGIHRFINAVTHYILPLAFILDWILYEQKQSYPWRYALIWLVYPLLYLLFSQLHGSATGDYLYPFLDRPTLGIGGLATWVAILFAVFIGLGCTFIGLNHIWGAKEAQ